MLFGPRQSHSAMLKSADIAPTCSARYNTVCRMCNRIRSYALALFRITQRVPRSHTFLPAAAGYLTIFRVSFFRATRIKTTHIKRERIALPKAEHVNCVREEKQ